MLSVEQIGLVQSTFPSIALATVEISTAFYARLFELDPSLQPLFKGTMPEQGYKLMQMIGTAVMGLDRFDELVPAIEDLGRRHLGYGVKKEHYDTVGEALLWTLREYLGDEFTAEVSEAWTSVYLALAGVATRVYVHSEKVQ